MSDITRRCHSWPFSACLTMITQLILMLIIMHGDNDVASAENQTIYLVSRYNKKISSSEGEDICKRKGGTLLTSDLDYSLSGAFVKELQQYVERTNVTDVSFSDNTFFLKTDHRPIQESQKMTNYSTVSLIRDKYNENVYLKFLYDVSKMKEMYLNGFTGVWRVNIGKIICQIELPDNCSFSKTTKLYYKDYVNIDEMSTFTKLDLTTEPTNPGLSTRDSEQSSMLPTTNIKSTSQGTTDRVSTRGSTAASSHFWTQTNKVSQTATSASKKDTESMSSSVTNSADYNSPSMPVTSSTDSDKVTFTTVTSNTDQQASLTGEQKTCSPKRGDKSSKEEKAKFTEVSLAGLTIDTKKTGANVRRYTSANDERLSAQTAGWVAALFLGLVLAVPILSDLLNLIIYISKVRAERRGRVNDMEMKTPDTVKSADG